MPHAGNNAAVTPVTRAFIENHASLKRCIFCITQGVDVEDIAQETFIRAYQQELVQVIEKPKGFLFRIAKNLAIDRADKLKWVQYESEVEDERLEYDYPENCLIAMDSIAARIAMLDKLSKPVRAVYLLRSEGLSLEEVAQRLKLARSTVEKHCMKIARRIRALEA